MLFEIKEDEIKKIRVERNTTDEKINERKTSKIFSI